MAKISVSIDDELVEAVRHEAKGNVSRFVSEAVREAVSRAQMLRGLAELDDELGPVDAGLRAEVGAVFDEVAGANARTDRGAGAIGPSARRSGSKGLGTTKKASVSDTASKPSSVASRGSGSAKVTRAAVSGRFVRED